jgi:tRNA A-37 threonylcarbamoyl transferase component Bud32
MTGSSSCPTCGKPVALNAPHGLCPECLMQTALSPGTQTDDPASSPETVPPSVAEIASLFPQLEIIELLGRGGMGAVYKARQPHLDRLVALKILLRRRQNPDQDNAFAERFAREARALAKLSHPNIVAVYDYGQAGSYSFLLMEYVNGPNLRQLLQRGKMAPEEALVIVPKICEALQFAHLHGVVHRDIKPENILLDNQGQVKIGDFGIAKMADVPAQAGLTQDQQVIGTPHYMAPEQVEKPQTVDHRADIYSLGVVFYEMLTGELPLGKFAPPSQKSGGDPRLDSVVLHTLEKEPARRYQQASQVKTDVETIAASPAQEKAQAPIPQPTRAEPGKTRAKATRWKKILLLGGLALVITVAVIYLTMLIAGAGSKDAPLTTTYAGTNVLGTLPRPQRFNVDFGPWRTNKSEQVGPAAAGEAGDFWNTVAVPNNDAHTESGLKSATGGPSPIGVEMLNLGGNWNASGSMGVQSPMLDTFNYPADNHGGDAKVILHHVPPGKYQIFIYGHGTEPLYYGDYELAVGKRRYGRMTTSHNTDAIQNTNWVEGSQYVCFRGVTVAPGENVMVLIRAGGPSATPGGRMVSDAMICGLQLIPAPHLGFPPPQ